MCKALWNNCLFLWELDSLTLEVLSSLIFHVCLFDHNSGKGAHALGLCPLRLKLNLSSLHNHLILSFDFLSLLYGLIFHVFFFFFFVILCFSKGFLINSMFFTQSFHVFQPKVEYKFNNIWVKLLNSHRASRFRIRYIKHIIPILTQGIIISRGHLANLETLLYSYVPFN